MSNFAIIVVMLQIQGSAAKMAAFIASKCNRLLFSVANNCEVRFERFQHESQVATVKQGQLPPNLVLIGISKEQRRKKAPIVDVSPPDSSVAVIRQCVDKIPLNKRPIRVWVDNLTEPHPLQDKAAELHPNVFGVHPRMDILNEVVKWQKIYREMDYAWSRTRSDMGRGHRKPWPQKGTGKKRQGSRVPPFWHKGAICHGPRGPAAQYYQLSDDVLIQGLTIALTVKLIQNDLLLVEKLEDAENEKQFQNFLENRDLSDNTILFVHPGENGPQVLSELFERSRTMSMMPTVGLNVYSILKHDKLVLPVDILNDLETKIIWARSRYRWLGKPHNFYKDMPGSAALKQEYKLLTEEEKSNAS